MPADSSENSRDAERELKRLYGSLRRYLVLGRLARADEVSAKVEERLKAKEDGANGKASRLSVHQKAMHGLRAGIRAILRGDNHTGITRLGDLEPSVLYNVSLRWVSDTWRAKALCGAGKVNLGRRAARDALGRAVDLEVQDRSFSLSLLGEIEHLSGNYEQALTHLHDAETLYKGQGDRRGVATARLAQAKMMAAAGRELESGVKAFAAAVIDPTWTEPVIFLARTAMKSGRLEQAQRTLSFVGKQRPSRLESLREMVLLQLALSDKIPTEVLQDFLRLEEMPPGDRTVEQLQELVERCPDFVQLRENLAWKLVKMGRYTDAAKQFEALSVMKLDHEVRASVMLGRGVVATVRQDSRQPGKKVKAAVSAVPPALAAPGVRPDRPRPDSGARDDEPVGADSSLSLEQGILEGENAVFLGGLDQLSVPDLLQFFYTSRQTGTLVVSSDFGLGAIYLRNGRITGAASPACANIGDLLVSQGVVDEQQLDQAMSDQSDDSQERLLGAILVEKGVVDVEAMRGALTSQVYTAISELMTWTEGRFAFSPDFREATLPTEVEIDLDPQVVLLDSARQMDEANRDMEEAAAMEESSQSGG